MSDFIQRSEVLLGEISKEFESLGLTQLYLDYRVGELLHKRLMNHWHGVEITEE